MSKCVHERNATKMMPGAMLVPYCRSCEREITKVDGEWLTLDDAVRRLGSESCAHPGTHRLENGVLYCIDCGVKLESGSEPGGADDE